MKRLFLSLLLMSFSVCAMDDDKLSYVDPETADFFSSPFEEVPQIPRKIKFDFGDHHESELKESWYVDFDSEQKQIIASFYRDRQTCKCLKCSMSRNSADNGGLESTHVIKDIQTGQLDISAIFHSYEDRIKFGNTVFFAKPDSAIVFKLKQKIAEFEQRIKAKG